MHDVEIGRKSERQASDVRDGGLRAMFSRAFAKRDWKGVSAAWMYVRKCIFTTAYTMLKKEWCKMPPKAH